MTLGQRTAQKRKELGLSQEALGEHLGVSRQSIYKWESGTALPEIEKLIALSKLFGVSVGWLLGVEEDAAPEAASGELTETQLKMVREIVDRYLAAQPKPRPRRRWPWALAAAVLVLAGGSLFQRLDRMGRQYDSLQSAVSNVTYSVNSQISGISNRVEELLKAQNELTADYSTQVVSTDCAENLVTFSFRAIPKTFSPGMTAWLEVQNEAVKFTFGPFSPQGQTFTGEATVALTDDISLYIVFESGGQRQTQLLDTYSGLYSATMPSVSVRDYDLMFAEAPGGVLSLSDVYVSTRRDESTDWNAGSAAGIAEVRVGLFQNRKLLAWAKPCGKPDSFRGFEGEDFYRLPDMTVTLADTDELAVAALVTDEYGRQTMCCDIPYVLDTQDGILTYPSYSEADPDPAHWQFK